MLSVMSFSRSLLVCFSFSAIDFSFQSWLWVPLKWVKKYASAWEHERSHTEALTLFLTEIQTVDGLCSVIGHDERSIVGLAGFLRENTLNRDFAVFEQGCHHLLG